MTTPRRLASAHDREILRLAVPAFGALVAEPLFLLSDSAIVGHLGTAQLGGLGVAGQALNTLVYLCVFLAYGTTAGVARQVGAGDLPGAIRQGIDGMWLAVAIGAVLVVAGWPLVPWIVDAFGASPGVAPYAETYLRVSLFGIPSMLVVLAGTGVLRGLQDTRTPLLVSIGGFSLNLLLNAVFVMGLGWGIAGSAWGTVLAQTGSAVVYVAVVLRAARRHGLLVRPDWDGLRTSATAGFGLLVRTAALRVVLIVGTSIAARMGDPEIAAYQVGFQVWTLLAFALDAIAIAGQAITGRYLGASDITATRAVTRRMVWWGVGCGVVFGLAILVIRPWLPALFTSDGDVRDLLLASLLLVAALQPVAGVVFVLDGILIGAGDGAYLAVTTLVATAVFLPAALVVHRTDAGLAGLWAAIGLWMLTRMITLSLRARGDRWMVTGATR
ncbi:putative MATE family efflux protein [Actinomadura coerulea]|uniref:Putative MATE family efflux protein n=1 Tax=Actinomadura coerulea TaxID=46159 RepID=A0A7X0G349_9ACTN|nr:MATE family efflux transporter [Actinomadura coerulea]MBB6398585.1 putative MATE family efflux protein [Actinomadura coerulea]GGQ00804.1 MATE family efflux transporter [Actinomadura coerulea]